MPTVIPFGLKRPGDIQESVGYHSYFCNVAVILSQLMI